MRYLEAGALLLREMVCRPRWAWYHLWGHVDERYLLPFHQSRLADTGRYRTSFDEILARARQASGAPGGPFAEEFQAWLQDEEVETSAISRRSDGSNELLRLVWRMTLLLRPEKVVEVGVGRGASTRTILTAMRRNGKGHLYSVEFPALRHGYAEEVGVLVDADVRNRWTLLVGPSQVVLPGLRKNLGIVDLFVHDGAHSYHVQRGDYEEAVRSLKSGGVLISDDVNNDSFLEVAERNGLESFLLDQGKSFPIGVAFKTSRPS